MVMALTSVFSFSGRSPPQPPISAQSSALFAGGMPNGPRQVRVGASGAVRRSVTARFHPADNPYDATKDSDAVLQKKPNPKKIVAIVLATQAGRELFPLTKHRAKPAVPIGGAYRLIDIPMSNCLNSGLNQIYVLTQYNSQSLNRHIHQSFKFGIGRGFVEVLAATQRPEFGNSWSQETNFVQQFSWILKDPNLNHSEHVLVLSGDHLYQMDYMDLLTEHLNNKADISVCCVPIDGSRASDHKLLQMDVDGRIQFTEKPKDNDLGTMQFPCLTFMGLYLFKKDVLIKLLSVSHHEVNDFGEDLIPVVAEDYKVQGYVFDDYWEDLSTFKAFFDANLALTEETPRFKFHHPDKPIITSARNLPPAIYENCEMNGSIISHGCKLGHCKIEHSIVGVRSILDYGVELKDTVMMGADRYETQAEISSLLSEGKVPIGVGRNTKITNCIIDKNARIGRDVVIRNVENLKEAARESMGFYIQSGITVIMKNATIPDGTII